MSLVSLYNVPSDKNGMNQFSFNNSANHDAISTAILQRYSKIITKFIIDPIPEYDIITWLQNHQAIHDQQNQVLGIVGSDLTGIDFKDPAQLTQWIWLHASEHQQACSILGVS